METILSGSAFTKVLQETIKSLPAEQRADLPLGILMLEADGSISAFNVPITDDNVNDVTSSMFAMEYILHAFNRFDWMQQYVNTLENEKRVFDEKQIMKNRAKFRLIPGGKKEYEEG